MFCCWKSSGIENTDCVYSLFTYQTTPSIQLFLFSGLRIEELTVLPLAKHKPLTELWLDFKCTAKLICWCEVFWMGVSNQKQKHRVSVLHCKRSSPNQENRPWRCGHVKRLERWQSVIQCAGSRNRRSNQHTIVESATWSMRDNKSGHQPPFTVYMFIISREHFLCAVCTKRAVMRDVKHTKVLLVYVRKYCCKQNMLPFVFCFFNHSIL